MPDTLGTDSPMGEAIKRSSHGISRYHILVFAGCWLGGIFDGMDSTLMSVVMPLAVPQLLGTADKAVVSPVMGYITSVFLLGWMLGGILFGMIGDKLGRLKSMILSILLYSLFTGLAGLSQSWEHLAICRFLTGLGIGGEMVSIATFLAEVWPERSRVVAIGCLITSYQAGVLLAGFINNQFPDWRTTFFVGALPALLVILLRMTLKESDKWMADKEKRDQLKASGHAEDASQWGALFHASQSRNLLIGGLAFGGLLVGYWASLSWIPTWIQSLIPEGTGVGNERSVSTMFQGVAGIVGCAVAGVLCDRIGRKNTLLLACLGSFAASALLFNTNAVFSPIIHWENALLGFFIGILQAAMYIYLPELFPTRIRATATGFCLNVGRFVTAAAVPFVSTLVLMLGGYGQAAFMFSIAYLLSFVAITFGKETKGLALPD